MFVPGKFAETDPAALDWLAEHDAFATLVTTADGEPFASHIPVLCRREDGVLFFDGHLARANPQWRHLKEQTALLILHGPHAYVSPSWYPDPQHSVPTWNYAVAHAYGAVEVFEDEPRLEALVAALTARYEAGIGSDWRFPEAAPATRHELRGIVGFHLRTTRVEVKFKLNQHHPAEKVRSAAAALAAQPHADARAVGALMLDRLARREPA